MTKCKLPNTGFSESMFFATPTLSDKLELPPIGLGLRREHLDDLMRHQNSDIGFLELAPENWIPFGGLLQKKLEAIAGQYPLICHGLSLNIGGPDPLNLEFLKDLKQFFSQYPFLCYSEHLSYTAAGGQLYDLLPMPFRKDAIKHCVSRIHQVQDTLQRRLVLENISYYTSVAAEMTELEFILEVLEQADCQLLLDVNNVYVNSVNHGYDPFQFIAALPTNRILYGHIAGHYVENEHLLIDTHGADVCGAVWELLAFSYQCHGGFPTLLERDFNLPQLSDLQMELGYIRQIQQRTQATQVKIAL